MPLAMTWTVLDFETASNCDLKKCGAARYAEDPTTEIICLGFQHQLMTEPIVLRPVDLLYDDPESGLARLVNDPTVVFIAHNVLFEKFIWREIMVKVFAWPDIPNHRWHDTQAVCAMKVIPQDLDRASPVLRLSIQKDKEGSALAKSLSKPNKKTGLYDRSEKTLARVYAYCGQDVLGEVEMHETIGWLPAGERRVWLLNQRVNERGLQLDMDYVRKSQEIVDKASAPLIVEFADLTGGLKMTQIDKFKGWLETQGLRVGSLDKEHLAALLGGDLEVDDDGEDELDTSDYTPVMSDDVHRALSIRQLIGSASIKKLARMEACVCADGRARGLLQYHGTGPGRSAGRLLQPHNFPRGTLKLGGEPPDPRIVVEAIMTGDPDYVSMMLGPPVETVLSGLRHSIIAAKKRLLMAGDYAGIQARTVLGLAGQHDKTALMAVGKDIYVDMAAQIYKRPIDKKKDPAERQTGKNSVLGLGFQMGWKKFKKKYAKEQPDEFCEEVVRVYRKEWAPKVPELWYGLQDAAIDAVWSGKPREAYGVTYQIEGRWLSCRLHSGRKIWYFNPRQTRRPMPWDETDIRRGFSYNVQKMGQWRTIDAFGGQLAENVVMGIERDLMTNAMLTLEKEGFPVCLEVHDEIVSEPLAVDADEKAFIQIMEDVPQWCRDLQIPVAVEGWTAERYHK